MNYTLKDPVRKMKKAVRSMGSKSYPNTECVHLDESGDILSTDSYRVFRMERAWNGPSVDIPADVAKSMSRCKVKGNETAEITPEGKGVTVKMGDGSEFSGTMESTRDFPNVKQFFDVEPNTVIRALKGDVLHEARAYKRLKAEKMIFEVKDGKLRTVAYGCEWSGKRDYSGAEVEGRDIAIGFNPKYVVDTLNSMGDELVIEIEDNFKPAVFRDAALWEELAVSTVVMPMKLGNRDFETLKDEKEEDKMETEIEITTARVDITPEGVKATPIESHVEKVGFGWIVFGASEDGTAWLSFSKLMTNRGACNWLKRVAIESDGCELVETHAEYVDSQSERDEREAEIKERLKSGYSKVVTWIPTTGKSGFSSIWERPEPKQERPEPKPEPKVEESAAVEITVETIREKFEGDGIAVNQAREGACIWVNGDLKECRKELKELGFKRGNSKKFGKGMWIQP